MLVTKVYDDGRLVSCKKTGKPPLDQADSRCLAALGKEFSYEMDTFLFNVSVLRKELKTTKRLLLSRTKERNSVKKAHRQRLAQVYFMRERMDELKLECLILQEDLSSWVARTGTPDLSSDTVSTVNSKRPSLPPLESRLSNDPEENAEENAEENTEKSDYTFSIKATAVKKG